MAVPVPPSGERWHVRTIEFSRAPDGTASALASRWQAKRVPFGVGRPYSVAGAQAAMKEASRYYRQRGISGKPKLQLKSAEAGDVTLVIR
jgi:hypothetical protein